ncbi:MAG: hypothetical protein Q8886_02920, partial [Candidatus Phytoplasma australasiaticum]|nr:hypothetical protein [Candidatus Phytoplasma australasiaticum]
VDLTRDNQRGCSYKSFMSCKPVDFHGTGGATEIMEWIEKTESVLKVSGCSEEQKVMYAACTFQGKALTWWNTEVRTRGSDEIDAMTWEQFKELLILEFCPHDELERIEREFWELTMVGANIQGYTNRFYELSRVVPDMVRYPYDLILANYMYHLGHS